MIDSPAHRLWAMISDLTRMGEWSPENEGAKWLGGATGPAVGARFRGVNRHGKRRWSTVGRVVESEPARSFAFTISAIGLPVAEWRYQFDDRTDSCLVTETWLDRRGRLFKLAGKPVSGVSDRASHNRTSMEETLRRLKAAAETNPG